MPYSHSHWDTTHVWTNPNFVLNIMFGWPPSGNWRLHLRPKRWKTTKLWQCVDWSLGNITLIPHFVASLSTSYHIQITFVKIATNSHCEVSVFTCVFGSISYKNILLHVWWLHSDLYQNTLDRYPSYELCILYGQTLTTKRLFIGGTSVTTCYYSSGPCFPQTTEFPIY